MKLPRPFFRLPVRFDAERLRAEVEALPAGAWTRHPNEHAGNTAARLITAGGGDNDDVSGEMKPTAALGACPYVRQVLASFGTVWSRSRFMRIEGGASVPKHSDVHPHWFHRVRLHVPVITRPEVRFFCGGESVHMAAGEAWVFDNWREHRVENPAAEARVHLVADTAGTSAFWRLVTRAQSQDFAQPDLQARLIAFDAAAAPRLLIERINAMPVMPPSEVDQLAVDLLADLEPVDARPDSAAAVNQFASIVLDFCRDWRSLWSLFGMTREGRPQYERLLAATHRQIAGLPPVRVASNGYNAQAVLVSRLLGYALTDDGRRREAAEFNVAARASAAAAAKIAAVEPPPVDEPTLSSLPTLELPQVELPTVEVPRIETVTMEVAVPPPPVPEPHKPPVLDRPIVILSAPRAGSTLLFETLAQASGVYTIGGESHQLIESIAALRPGRGVVNSNRLTRRDATTAIVAELRQRFTGRINDRDGQPPPSGAAVRLLEKTPKNALRVPFLLEVFPDARFVFLHREVRANLSSMMQAWRGGGWVTYRLLAGWNGPWSLLLPPGYERLRDRPLEEVVAFQWQAANETILEDLANVPRERWTTLRYEELVLDPAKEVAKLVEFAGLSMDPKLAAYLAKPLPLSRHTKTPPRADKWKQDAAEIERVLPELAGVGAKLRSAGLSTIA